MIDELDRVIDGLMRVLGDRPRGYTEPFTIGELVQTLLPYRRFRTTLGFDSAQDYEIAVMRLLAGERGYLATDAPVREALQTELRGANPDPAAYRVHAKASVTIAPPALQRAAARAALADAAEPSRPSTRPSPPVSSPPATEHAPMAIPTRAVSAEDLDGHCRHCGGALPTGRRITFCPSCGQNLTVQRCPACSSEVEVGWKFCVTCGRDMTAT